MPGVNIVLRFPQVPANSECNINKYETTNLCYFTNWLFHIIFRLIQRIACGKMYRGYNVLLYPFLPIVFAVFCEKDWRIQVEKSIICKLGSDYAAGVQPVFVYRL